MSTRIAVLAMIDSMEASLREQQENLSRPRDPAESAIKAMIPMQLEQLVIMRKLVDLETEFTVPLGQDETALQQDEVTG